uniref:Cell cycle control protein n=1 Tax=Lepisosteus oculatus TaxID=7918 RepID=W5MSY7_LEPOC|nr:PREDICTED: cell cycle control protein 50C-like [Lepisosteus oculatus]
MPKENDNIARRPDSTAFKQQKLPAWSPSLTAETVLPFFFLIGLLCVLTGAWLLVTVAATHEIKIDYTNTGNCSDCYELRENRLNSTKDCQCTVTFSLPEQIVGDVYVYYGLINFHQNLRRYMDSRDDAQLVGRTFNLKNPSSTCAPFDKYKHGTPIAPCGAIANSMFNDSFQLVFHPNEGMAMSVPLLRTGIAWYTDKNVKFRNPGPYNESLSAVFAGTSQPFYWQKPVFELDPTDTKNDGFVNDDFIVWMREAAFPNFKKLYGRLSRFAAFADGLPGGNYSIQISYNFPVKYFQGKKLVILSTVSWFGGQNRFLPIAYTVTGGVILIVAMILTGFHLKFGKRGLYLED